MLARGVSCAQLLANDMLIIKDLKIKALQLGCAQCARGVEGV